MSDELRNVAILKQAYERWSDTLGASGEEWLKICAENIQFGSIADAPQGAAVFWVFPEESGWRDTANHKDLARKDRFVTAMWPGE